ncbi:MAG: TetR/AcrR family transcriptional regulator [Bacteroidota bacterium]|nr:TetR/AcrR family transcriptional regulator [Bacteroidota bacterium]
MEAKDRILLKAHELFNRYGIRSVSMDDIAAQSGMSKKTVYQYFTDKEELVGAVFNAIMEGNIGDCCNAQKVSQNALDEVFLAFGRVQEMFANMNPAILFDMKKYHPETFKKFKEYQNGFLYGMIKANLERGVKEGLYREDIDIDTLTRYRIHSVMLPFDPEVFPNNRTQLVHIEQELVEHFLYGLATAKGDKIIDKYKKQRTKK